MSVPVHNLLRTVQLEGSWKFEIFCQTLGGIEIVILLILHVFRNIYVSCVVNYVYSILEQLMIQIIYFVWSIQSVCEQSECWEGSTDGIQ